MTHTNTTVEVADSNENCDFAIIRDATLKDAMGISMANIASYRYAYKGIIDENHLATLNPEEWKKKFEIRLKAADLTVKVIDLKGCILGFISYGKDKENEDNSCEIYGFYISPTFHGKGLGQKLFKIAFQNLKNQGYTQLKIWALKDNRFRRFYELQGGSLSDEKAIRIGNQELVRVLYRWNLDSEE